MYRKILVPLDGSAFAEASLPLAMEISRRTGASVHLATVLEPVTSFAYEGWEGAADEWSRQYLEEVAERIGDQAGGAVTGAVLNGHTVEMLQAEAEKEEADVVVMASHGRGTLSRMWLGSVADGFVRHTDRPVVIARPEEDAKPPTEFDHTFKTMLIPLDGTHFSEAALEHATEFGELFDASYHLVRVVSYPVELASPYLPHTAQLNQQVLDDAKEGAEKYLEDHAARLRADGRTVTTSVVVDAQTGSGIVSEAEAVKADMVAMATHARAGVSRAVLGSAADKVLRGLHRPILLYRPPEDD